ncbi:MAG: sugar phosphate nucleotidyltransferase [Oxalobacter sp.]
MLLTVYDKPMVYYPLSTMIAGGIQYILIITKESDLDNFQKVLGNGSQWGIKLTYMVQYEQKGIADNTKAKTTLNWPPKKTLTDSVSSTCGWEKKKIIS